MPRRRALTDAQLENLLALPVIEADLICHWTLAAADLAVTERRRGHNQLGYALQLCAFRYPGRLLRPGEAIPETALHFVANQLRVSADILAAYAARPQTRREQLDGLREGCTTNRNGYRNNGAANGRMIGLLKHQGRACWKLVPEMEDRAGCNGSRAGTPRGEVFQTRLRPPAFPG